MYGSEYASFTLGALLQAAKGVTQPSLTADIQVRRDDEGGQDRGRGDTVAAHPPLHSAEGGQLIVHLQPFHLPLHAIEHCGNLLPESEPSRSYILDLIPKVRSIPLLLNTQRYSFHVTTYKLHINLPGFSFISPDNHYQVMYQGEPLVEVLVKAKAQHYLEFKRLEGRWEK